MSFNEAGSRSGSRTSTRLLRALPFAAGIALLAYILYGFGSAQVWENLRAIGWGCAVIILLELVAGAFNAQSWWYTLPRDVRRGSLVTLFLVQMAGSALNDMTPAGALYGEPVKVLLLRDRIPVSVTAASLMSSKLAQALARALFVMIGMLAASGLVRPEGLPVKTLATGFALTAAGVGAFMALQIRGFSRPLKRASARLRILGGWIERVEQAVGRVDDHLRELYRERPRDFVAAVLFALGGLGMGVVQVWLLLQWIGLGRNWPASATIEAFAVLVAFVSFVVPGSLGIQEGGKLLIFAALGLPLSAGLSVGVTFRLNNVANQLLGLLVLVCLRPQRALRRAQRIEPPTPQRTVPDANAPRGE